MREAVDRAGCDQAERAVHAVSPFYVGSRHANGSEGGGLAERDLAGLAQLEQRKERDRLLHARETCDLAVEVEETAAGEDGAKALEELGDGREAKRHMAQGDVRRRRGQPSQRVRERGGILRREPPLGLGRERLPGRCGTSGRPRSRGARAATPPPPSCGGTRRAGGRAPRPPPPARAPSSSAASSGKSPRAFSSRSAEMRTRNSPQASRSISSRSASRSRKERTIAAMSTSRGSSASFSSSVRSRSNGPSKASRSSSSSRTRVGCTARRLATRPDG